MNLKRLFRRQAGRPQTSRLPLVELLEGRQLLTTFSVINVNDAGPGSLRRAINNSNATPGTATNTINFQIPGSGLEIIGLASALPAITHPVIIDGTTQIGSDGALEIVLDGTNAGSTAVGLDITASNSTVKGLVIVGFGTGGVLIDGASGNQITNNLIGVTGGGNVVEGNGYGVNLQKGANHNTIGGTSASDANVISGNKLQGVLLSTSADDNTLQGNFIGTNEGGTAALGNGFAGVALWWGSDNNVIGGTAAGAGNTISANGGGINIQQSSDDNVIQGNFIGTNAGGTEPLGNVGNGVGIGTSSNGNVIGGSVAGAGNTIAANGQNGVLIDSGSADNSLQGNFIGTNLGGTAALGNGHAGLVIQYTANNNTIGGTAAGDANVISDNKQQGVLLSTGADDNTLQGNFIGTNEGGTTALGNGFAGVALWWGSDNNVIGGTAAGAGNTISANGGGINIQQGSNGNLVQGNFIGTNTGGTAALGNGSNGVGIGNNSDHNTVGGSAAGAGNTIAANGQNGVLIDSGSADSLLQGNFIGTNLGGTAALGNGYAGLVVQYSANYNTIGGTAAGDANVISGNRQQGVLLMNNADDNTLQGNYIGTNAGGTAALGNAFAGVALWWGCDNNVIGGTAADSANTISANGGGINIQQGSNANLVQGNFIGTNAGGTAALGNRGNGVGIGTGSEGNNIGGTAASAGNIIAANGQNGILISDSATYGNSFEGNFIGTNASGSTTLGNSGNGVMIMSSASNNTIGGTAAGAGNTISHNRGAGVELNTAGVGNVIEDDVIDSNGSGQSVPYGDGVYVYNTSIASVIGCTIDSNRDWGILLISSPASTQGGNTLNNNGLGSVHTG